MKFRHEIKLLQQKVARMLTMRNPPATNIILMTYDRVIRPNFILWLKLTSLNCVDKIAIRVCEENLKCEIGDNHPQMLLNFVFPIITESEESPALRKYAGQAMRRAHEIERSTERKLRQLCLDPMCGLIIMAALENASLKFIPWMRKAAKQVNLDGQQYLDVHGEADIEHADAFLVALDAESEYHEDNEEKYREALSTVTQLLKKIFILK